MNKYLSSVLCPLSFALCPLSAADVVWFDGQKAVSCQVEGTAAPVVSVAMEMFADDMLQVTGQRAVQSKDGIIRIVELDKARSGMVTILRRMKVPVDSLQQSMDAFFLAPYGGQIWVVGNNGRGCAYGLLELSRQAGVSPWVWWGDVVPERRERLVMSDAFRTLQAPAVQYRGIFINDEDWSLRRWKAPSDSPGGGEKGRIGPEKYRRIFELLLRLRANTLWPAMHEGTEGFFTVKGNKALADAFGILIGTSHCEPLLRNNVAEWDVRTMGRYNYITNRDRVKQYWAERLKEVKGSEELFTIGMRGIHDGSMEGVKTREEKLSALQQVIDDQRQLISRYYDKNVERVPQVFIPYKEVLEIYESGLRVPDDVMLMWCDDNYGYLTRLPDAEQQRRSGGGGIYYHLSYWGRPHDHLWLTTTQPGLIYTEMKAAYDYNCRRLWIANVHDPKVAAYDLELFLDMAWGLDNALHSDGEGSVGTHLTRWLATQFGHRVAAGIASAMQEFFRLNAIRRPEFMGWTQTELDKNKYPGGKSLPTTTQFTQDEACQRLADFGAVEATVDAYARLVPERLQDAYFASVLYPVHAAAAMSRKMLSDAAESHRAYEEIQRLTERYDTINGGKWQGLMSAAPRELPVFGDVRTVLATDTVGYGCCIVARNADGYDAATEGCQTVQMLGHSMSAVSIPKGGELTYEFSVCHDGDATLYTAMIPTQPSDRGDLRYSVQVDDLPVKVISLKEKYRSEGWKQNVLRGQALKQTPVRLTKGKHTLRVKALDDHIIFDQWMIDFQKHRPFYVIPVKKRCASESRW